jgi:hypothetical protein
MLPEIHATQLWNVELSKLAQILLIEHVDIVRLRLWTSGLLLIPDLL